MPEPPRYEAVAIANDTESQLYEGHDYLEFGIPSNAHANESTPGSETVPLTHITPPDEVPPLIFSNSVYPRVNTGSERSMTSESIHSDRLSISKLSRWSIHSPWDHDVPKDLMPARRPTARTYNYRTQRSRLFRGGILKWLMTIALCGSIAGALASFQRKWALPLDSKHSFNAIITGLSVALSLNLASSFRYYAQLVRWKFLASDYRSLKEFDLLLSCDSQVKVIRLLWEARRRPFFRYPFLTWTQLACIGWLLLNMSAQVLVAMLGLTYNLDPSPTRLEIKQGLISVADLSIIRDTQADTDPSIYQQHAAAQAFGIQAQDYNTDPVAMESDAALETIWYGDDYWEYIFADWNPYKWDVNVISGRYIDSSATCVSYKVVDGGWGNETEIVIADNDGNTKSVYIDETSPGATTFISDTARYCGARCTRVMAFQAEGASDAAEFGIDIPYATFWDCNSTVSHVLSWEEEEDPAVDASLDLPDEQARIAAGAIGWTGFFYDDDTREYQLYSTNSPWSLSRIPDSERMAKLISQFAIGVIAAMDDHGPRMNMTGDQPSTALTLTVKWKYAVPILAVIPSLQFFTLLLVVSFANKVVIKDDTHLGIARLLRPVVEKLGDGGCMLTGKEISEELRMKVIYSFREPKSESEVYHLDLIPETEAGNIPRRSMRSFDQGVYDGTIGGGRDDEGFSTAADDDDAGGGEKSKGSSGIEKAQKYNQPRGLRRRNRRNSF